MQSIPSDDLVVLPRPHFELREGGLYFLLSTRPLAELNTDEAELWKALDGTATVGQLEQRKPGAKVRLQRLWTLGACEFAAADFPSKRKRILVIEPHMDDAILSVGGLMWSLRESCEFTLVTAGGRSNFTSYYMMGRDFFDVQRVSELRNAESALVMRLLGGRHVDLALSEAPLRYHDGNWTLDWFKRHRKAIGGFIGHSGTEEEIESWAAAIERVVLASEAEEIWMPLGIGSHADHELTRNACLRVLARVPDVAKRCDLFLYQDVPYASSFPWHTSQVVGALTESGAALEQRLEDIVDAFESKLRLLSIYGSQFKMSYMSPKVEAVARMASPDGAGRFECIYRLSRTPGAVDPFRVYSGRRIVEDLAVRLAPWYRHHRLAPRIRFLSPMPAGRWDEDLRLLLDAFPQAVLEVHVSENNLAETQHLMSPRIEVCPVRGAGRSWLLRLLKLGVSRPCPLIVLTGESRPAAGRAAKLACFMSDTLIGTRMTHLALAIWRVKQRSE